jgi:hypothetical protein
MKVRLPKSWDRLPQSEKDVINRVMTDEVVKQVCHEQAELQKRWLQFACIVLHKNFGFGKDRCLLFLANWREMYRINSTIGSEAEQLEYLSSEMEKIFGKDGYPKEYIDRLEEI